MTGLEIRVLVYGLLALALASGGWYVKSRLDAAKAAEAQVTALEGTAGATTQAQNAASDAGRDRTLDEAIARASRQAADRALREYLHANPDVAARLDEPVPQQLRDVARARREARERPAAD